MDIRGLKSLKAALLGLAASVVCVLGTATPARADFNFNPTGGVAVGGNSATTYDATSLQFGAGNALAVGAGQLTPGKTFTLLFQTNLTGINGPSGPYQTTPGTALAGLNNAYQVTEVAALNETVTSVSTVAGVTTVNFSLNPVGSLIKLYYNPAVTFDAIKGTGYNTGTVIATLNPSSFTASQYQDTTANVGTTLFNPLVPADTRTSNQGGGSTTINNSVTSYLGSFFNPPSGLPTLTSTIVKSNVSPVFDSIPAAIGVFNVLTSAVVAPNIGTNNGSGADFQLQVSGFTQSFTPVPEPTSMTLLGLGLVGVVFAVRNRGRVA